MRAWPIRTRPTRAQGGPLGPSPSGPDPGPKALLVIFVLYMYLVLCYTPKSALPTRDFFLWFLF